MLYSICNKYLTQEIKTMVIDEKEEYRPTNYGKKITKTDHNTIIIEITARKSEKKMEEVYLNTRCPIGLSIFEEKIKLVDVSGLFLDVNEMEKDYKKLTKLWNNTLNTSFEKVRRSKNKVKGLDHHVKKLIQEERKVKKTWVDGLEKESKLLRYVEGRHKCTYCY